MKKKLILNHLKNIMLFLFNFIIFFMKKYIFFSSMLGIKKRVTEWCPCHILNLRFTNQILIRDIPIEILGY